MFRIKYERWCLAVLFTVPALIQAEALSEPSVTHLAAIDKSEPEKSKNYEPVSGKNGSPTKRITVGGSRGSGKKAELSIYIPADFIVPSMNKGFVWELSEDIGKPVRFVIVTDAKTEPVYDEILPAPFPAKKNTTSASNLTTGVEYEWIMYICQNANCAPMPDEVARTTFRLAE